MSVADYYFVPSAGPLIVESLFRRYLGGEQNTAAIAAGRAGIEPALDVLDQENRGPAGEARRAADEDHLSSGCGT